MDLPVTVHSFQLPPLRKGRLHCPLSLCYVHPLLGHYRLASLGDAVFDHKWKRLGRWEAIDQTWADWRVGIDKDRCMDQITVTRQLEPISAASRKELVSDIRGLVKLIEKPIQWPRLRENCLDCMMHNYCHGTQGEKLEYIHIDTHASSGIVHQEV